MQSRTAEQVESWNARPFSGEIRELHDLADDDFSGTVVADDTWMFFLNGRVIGVFQGDIEDVSGSDGTIYAAPHPSLPLLFTMQERGGATQAKYFTNDTSIAEADETLREANFTGYLELSENVLSGDYYVTYYGGKSMSAAFIGQSERLEVGEEAFELANDEVGVFEVRKVSMNITELPPIPEETESSPAGGAVAASETDSDDAGADDEEVTAAGTGVSESSAADEPVTDSESATGDEPAVESEPATDDQAVAGSAQATDDESPHTTDDESTPSTGDESATSTGEESMASAGDETPTTAGDEVAGTDPKTSPEGPQDGPTETSVPVEEAESDAKGGSPATPDDVESTAAGPGTPGSRSPDPTEESPREADPEAMGAHERAVREWAAKDHSEGDEATDQDLFREEAKWRQTKSIPALDPDESSEAGSEAEKPANTGPTGERKRRSQPTGGTEDRTSRSDRPSRRRTQSSTQTESGSEPATGSESAKLSKLKSAVEARDRRIEALESELSEAESEREALESSVADLREERASLQERFEALEAKLESAESAAPANHSSTESDVPPGEALTGTNLFVRYDSKGKETLDTLEGSSVEPEAVNENLRLDYHTQFEASETTVEGSPYERFLHESSRYRFVEWLVRELPYELLDSGKTTGLQDVYDAIPEFDRIEFDGTVDAQTESGDIVSHDFDIVVRDRMGDPLIVADINDSRDPVEHEAMDSLVTGATDLGEWVESLAGAFYVTASYFEPGALELAQEAASAGGFFSRSDRQSYVKVSRKRGFHLCLVEDRRDAFHLTVPEL